MQREEKRPTYNENIANIMIQTGHEEEKLERAIKNVENLGMKIKPSKSVASDGS